MANYSTLGDLFTGIADAIRAKNGSAEVIVADNFPIEIQNLETGFDYNNHNVITIPDYGFKNCTNLKSVDCYNLTSIGTCAFENCKNLKNVMLYDGVESIGENAFKGCDCIIYHKGESVPETWNENWNPDGCIVLFGEPIESWDISATSADNVVADLYGNGDKYILFIRGNGDMKSYLSYSSSSAYNNPPWINYCSNINAGIIGSGITNVAEGIFCEHEAMAHIAIPNSVTDIGKFAFYGTPIVSITIPNNVTDIGAHAFRDCRNLTSITIPDSVAKIAESLCNYCLSLTSVIIGSGVTGINRYAFYACKSLTSITIPNGVRNIEIGAFGYCESLISITIPDSIINIGHECFAFCESLTSITYTGTIAQWNVIKFGEGTASLYSWNESTPNYTIHCTDGDIAKDGTITYH